MQISKSLLVGAAIFCCSPFIVKSQSLLNLADSAGTANQVRPLESTWKDTRLINAQTTKTPAPGVMLFRILHRFGNVGGASGGGVHTLYGFDLATDIYFSFEFGVTKNLDLGFGRSKMQELLDGSFKYRLLTQKSKGMPISLALYGDAGMTPEAATTFYAGADAAQLQQNTMDRLSYVGELLLDRRFGNHLSLEAFGGVSHRNYVLGNVNPANNAQDQNNITYAGGAGKIGLTKHASIVFDYYYIMSPYRTGNTLISFYNCLSVGYEVETGGHVFEINLSNGGYMNENNIVPYTYDTWTKGGFKIGFAISRAFNL